MQKAHTQQGSAHIIVIVALAVALAGTLGVVFYQNFIAKKSADSRSETTAIDTQSTSDTKTTTSSDTTKTTTVALKDGSIDASFGTRLTFKYPETWKLAQTMSGTAGTDSAWTQTTTLTSPSGKYKVGYNVGAGGGIGGSCASIDTGNVATVAYQAVSEFSGMSYVEITHSNMGSDTTGSQWKAGFVGLIDSKTASSLKSGDSVCDYYLHYVTKLVDTNYVQLLQATMTVDGVSTASELNAALSGTEYEQAKAILLSTTH